MKHIFLDEEETLKLFIEFINNKDKNEVFCGFKEYIKDIVNFYKISLKELRILYGLGNKKLEIEFLSKYLKEYYKINLEDMEKNKSVNKIFKKYINILNDYILEIDFFINNLKKISVKNWIEFLKWGYHYGELDTVIELMLNNTSINKIKKLEKKLEITIIARDFRDIYNDIYLLSESDS
ncbi:hypothetical protein [Campylobacter sp. RM12651]|uniref:hypothetical protein n=1 Tax=Campylobacter sp. RM12651 TaxID=1660079 RepID=UPI001EFB0BCF|nr:hypothetical protein [Campylobacter sp. RM12651]ULO04588.1 hypothetical protein AVBRAN_a0106 [Campylobacter sp. RM12651]